MSDRNRADSVPHLRNRAQRYHAAGGALYEERLHGVDVRASEDPKDTGRGFSRLGIDTVDSRVGVRTAQNHGVQHAWECKIVHVSADALDQARVFDPFHGLADIACTHAKVN